MFFKRKSKVIFRNYDSFGYITDNRNFGYKLTINNNNIGDKILSEVGAVFFSVLNGKPQTLEELANKISEQFTDTDIDTIKNDAREFYCLLEKDGFIVSGKTLQECEAKDTKFSYKLLENNIIKEDFHPNITHSKKNTQEIGRAHV